MPSDAPPPSTLAAQIVQNQTRQPTAQQNDQKTFASLLHELLHNRAAVQETDLATNVKLVNVVAEAGLAPLVDENPFAQRDQLVSQAKDGIKIIQTTIARQPEVVLTPTGPEGPKLMLPLIARLATLSGTVYFEELSVVELLDSIFRGLYCSTKFWSDSFTLRRVLEDCVDGR